MTKNIAFKEVNQGTALVTGTLPLTPLVIEGLEDFKGSFDRLCLRAGTAAIEAMLAGDVAQLCGQRYERHGGRAAHRWGVTMSEIDYHGGKAAVRRPRVRERRGAELELASWQAIKNADLLSRWAFNQMLIGVATRKYARSVRLPDGDLAGQATRATTKSSVSRRFVVLSTAKLKEWLATDLSGLDLLVIQIDGLRVGDHVLVAAIGIDGAGDKHVLALALGATENAAVVKALLADLVERGLQPDIARLFIVDGAKALSRAVRDTFGRFALIQRCQVHKGRNIIERLDPSLHAGVKKVLRQAWDSPTAEQAEGVLPGASARSRCPWRLGFDPRRVGRNAHRDPPGSARPAAALARLHQRDREHDGCPQASLPQRQTLAKCADGFAMDWNRHAGSQDQLPPLEGPQAAPGPESRLAAPSASGARRSGH